MQFDNATEFEVLQAFMGMLVDEAGAAAQAGDLDTAKAIHSDLTHLNVKLKRLVQERS